MAAYSFAEQYADFHAGEGVRRRSWPAGDFAVLAFEPPSPPAGYTVFEYAPTPDDRHADDWEAA